MKFGLAILFALVLSVKGKAQLIIPKAPPPKTAPKPPAPKPPPPRPAPDYKLHLPHEEYKLANGLRVVLSPDSAVPLVATALFYEVGTRTEDKDHTGYAHLMEHFMTEAPANAGAGEFTKYIQNVGGQIASAAHPTYSLFTTLAPSNNLAPILWMESGRMQNLAITAETLKACQDSIREERANIVTGYNQALLEGWAAEVFTNPQNTHSFVSNISAANVEEVTKFYRAWYTPGNAVLVLTGDFQTADAKKLIEQYFGPIPSQPTPQRPVVTEEPRAQGRVASFRDAHVGVPAVILGWQAPARRTPQWYALQMIDSILTKGNTARLPLNLVQGRQSLLQFQSGVGFPYETAAGAADPAEYTILAFYRPGMRPEAVLGAIQQEIDDIASRGIGEELARMKGALHLRRIATLENPLDRATLLGQYELLDGKLSLIDDDFLAILAVTPDSVQTTAKRILAASRRDVLSIEAAPRIAPVAAPKPTAPGTPR
jgi:predicted Zn-dependent peptidase